LINVDVSASTELTLVLCLLFRVVLMAVLSS